MNVSELFELTYWIDEEIIEKQIPQKYQTLLQVLQQNAQPNQQKQPFEAQQNDLLKTIEEVPLSQLTKEQLIFLRELGIAQSLGNEGTAFVEGVLYKNALDIATAAQKIQEILNKLNKGIQKSNQIKTGLDGCVSMEDYEESDEVMIRVTFSGNASMSNVTDFKKWGNTWHEIGRGIAMANDSSPENIKIVGATKGSVILELATNPAIATTASAIIFAALKLAEKVLDIKKKAEEIKNLKLKNKKISTDLEKAAEEEKKAGIEKICDNLKVELKIGQDSDGDKVTALNKAVKDLIDFVEFGGEVDFVIPEDSDEEGDDEGENAIKPEYEKLRTTIQEIRLLETKLKLLESGMEEESDAK